MYNVSMYLLRNHLVAVLFGVIVVLLIGAIFFLPADIFAQEDGGIVPCNGPDCNFCSLAQLGQNIINLAIYLAVFLSAILFAWAGWNYLTNFGDTGKVAKAHSVFANVAVGLIIILAAWLIIDTLMKTVLYGRFGPWNEVCGATQASYSNTFGTSDIVDVYQNIIDNQQ